jgi:hypothetical protein
MRWCHIHELRAAAKGLSSLPKEIGFLSDRCCTPQANH